MTAGKVCRWQTRKRWSRPPSRALPSERCSNPCPTPTRPARSQSQQSGPNGAKACEGCREPRHSAGRRSWNQQAWPPPTRKTRPREPVDPGVLRRALPRRNVISRSGRSVRALSSFVRQSIGELRKVVYPTGQQLINYFVVVLVFVLFVIAYVSLLDLGLGWAIFKIFS